MASSSMSPFFSVTGSGPMALPLSVGLLEPSTCATTKPWARFVVAATALYGPQAAALVEMFPTRVRYTAMSFPYHVGTGWVGGFLPVTSFALVAISGNIYTGLWYSVLFTGISVVVSILFLKETSGRHLREV